ncbi:hypothetical protein BLL52_3054 [Rhodoferax antarcticus ANT.BR]|uniref:Uncharacterized protein n=1 Tax=Rhodoferax antarcticus ANT.BR TaxID=1111071 RepID=A0A1Q8YC72_9BURK|nr:hypothetical protein BLL52_3054 [Rhodoferax antarcticus ANT.BR]
MFAAAHWRGRCAQLRFSRATRAGRPHSEAESPFWQNPKSSPLTN